MSDRGNGVLLAVDIGNSNVKYGIHDGRSWQHHWAVETVRERMPDEYAVLLRSFLAEARIARQSIERTVVSSVVPQLSRGMIEMLSQQTRTQPLVVSAEIDLGLTIGTDRPDALGADLIANAVAGYQRFGQSCIVINFGTATTLAAVEAPGVIRGTAIAAGLMVTANALVGDAAQLSHVELAPPPAIIGTNTRHSMQAGLLIGHVAMVEGLIVRMRTELGGEAKVIATGGLVSTLAPLTDQFDVVDPLLTLEGLRLIADRNCSSAGGY